MNDTKEQVSTDTPLDTDKKPETHQTIDEISKIRIEALARRSHFMDGMYPKNKSDKLVPKNLKNISRNSVKSFTNSE